MDYTGILAEVEEWFGGHLVELVISLAIILLYLISRRIIKRLVRKQAEKYTFDKARTLYINKITGMANSIAFTIILGFTWELSLSGLGVYFASIFTVVGVGLFANWSMLSNMTASVILFFFFPYKVGTKIRIQDGDNSVEGLILDIKVFYIEIETDDGRIVSYPNNIAIQKPFYHKPEED